MKLLNSKVIILLLTTINFSIAAKAFVYIYNNDIKHADVCKIITTLAPPVLSVNLIP
jgi:hypothetical protein